MIVTHVDLYSNDVFVATLGFSDQSSTSPYIIESSDGLGADNVISKFYSVSASRTKRYFDLSIGRREISFQLLFDPRYEYGDTPDTLRDILYKAIASNRTGLLTLKFMNGAYNVANIDGMITKFDAPRFTKTVVAQLTIQCVDQVFKSQTRVSYTDGQIEVGLFASRYYQITDSVSTSPHGFIFKGEFLDNVAALEIRDLTDDWVFRVEPGIVDGVNYGFRLGDYLYFSSEPNNKYLYISRGGVNYNLADFVAAGSVWPVLFPGTNTLRITPSTLWDQFYFHTLEHFHTFWGV